MKKLLLLFVAALGVVACTKPTGDLEVAAVQTGSISVSSLGVEVKESNFGASSSGKSDAVFSGTFTVNVGTLSESVTFDKATAADVDAAISGIRFDNVPVGDYNVSITVSGEQTLDASLLEIVSASTEVTIEYDTTSELSASLAPASAYLEITAEATGDFTDISVDTPVGYYTPGSITITALATDTLGKEYTAKTTLTLEKAKAYTVNFNADIDLNLQGSASFDVNVNGEFVSVEAVNVTDFDEVVAPTDTEPADSGKITESDLTFSGDYYYIQGQTYALNVNGTLALIVQVNAYESSDGSPSSTTSKPDIFFENGPDAVANGIAKLLELYNQ